MQVAVGSALDHGVWDSEGRWRHADPVAEVHVPQHLQRISPDDLVKVRRRAYGRLYGSGRIRGVACIRAWGAPCSAKGIGVR